MYQRFRWTPRNAPVVAFWGFGVPIATFFLCSFSNVRRIYRSVRSDREALTDRTVGTSPARAQMKSFSVWPLNLIK